MCSSDLDEPLWAGQSDGGKTAAGGSEPAPHAGGRAGNDGALLVSFMRIRGGST